MWKGIEKKKYVDSSVKTHQGENKRHSLTTVIPNPVTRWQSTLKMTGQIFLYIGFMHRCTHLPAKTEEYKSEFLKHLCKINIL